MLRKHEGFENDLVALEAQLQVLVEDSVRLQAKYPSNATAISHQQDNVVHAWNELKEKSALRSDQLAASCDLQSFLTQVRDLMSWASSLRATLQAEEHVRDAAGATALKIQHDAIYNEIEAREEKFRFLNELSDSMVQTGHYAAAEVEERCAALLDERQRLHTAWNKKKVLLEQKIDLFCFLRDAKQIDNLSGSQEAALSSSDFGQTVEVVQDQIKRHDAFEKLIQTQDEKVQMLEEHGRKLVEQNHYDSAHIDRRQQEVVQRRESVKQLCTVRRQQLDDALLYVQFVRDCAEAESWINEKHKKLEADSAGSGTTSDMTVLEDKIKKLQKHQALQAEVAANDNRINEIKKTGEILIGKNHESMDEIKTAVRKVLEAWNNLLHELDQRGRGLEEAQDILEFNNQLDKIEAWIRDKEMMVQAGDTGRDLEHCNALRRKLDDVDSDMRVDDQRIRNINVLADKLMSQGQLPNEMRSVQQRRDNFNTKWRNLQGELNAYRSLLGGAYEVHVFHRDVNDTLERIAEKTIAMSTDDGGRDLAAVDALIRKQEALERDMTAINHKIAGDEHDAKQLRAKYPKHTMDIDNKLEEVQDSWNNLLELSVKRKEHLNDAFAVHKFVSDVKEIEVWVNDIIKKMNSAPSPSTITESESQLELHQERKAEIDGRNETFVALRKHGEELVVLYKEKTVNEADVRKTLHTIEDLHNSLRTAWSDKERQLRDAHQLQQFKSQTDQIDVWLASKEAFLNNDDLGDSYAAVEALIKKHETFEKLLVSDIVQRLEQFTSEIINNDSPESIAVKQRFDTVLSRNSRLLASSEARKQKLQESIQLQQFLRNLYEADRWLHQKMQIALDENYRDSSNLQSKIQKHAAFDAELAANTIRIENVIGEGEKLVSAKHFADTEIVTQLEMLETDWQKLREVSQVKKARLAQAYDALIFGRSLDEFNTWMDEIEANLSSEDYGKDLASVNNLLKKHEIIEADVTHHSDTCDQITETDTKFFNLNHFMKDEVHEKAMNTVKRYHSLHEPTTIRRDNLEDSLLMHQFQRDAEDEMQWLNDKEPHAASVELGTSLAEVQSLQKKHQALEAEIISQEPLIQALLHRSQQMILAGHFASEELEQISSVLQKKLSNLKDMSSIRRLRLLDAVESQMFYVEANECETWMREKRPQLASTDYGKDEDSVQSLQKKLDALQRELLAFNESVTRVQVLSGNLVERNHFDSANIVQKNMSVQQQYDELKALSVKREASLTESKKLYEFQQEVDEVNEWIDQQMTVTASEEYGEDVEHVELLITVFESFISNLSANEQRVFAAVSKGENLVATDSPYKETIAKKVDETKQLWDELKDLVNARQDALAGAKQVHVYDRRADETITWIAEKETVLMSEDYGQDMETIQALVRKHCVFDTELAPVKEQVESVINEALKLAEVFPDAREHIEVKKDETIEAWSDLRDKTFARKDKLRQAEQLQAYFDEYRDLMAWINETIAKITAPDLVSDVAGAELLLTNIREHHVEIESRSEAFDKFYRDGQKLIADKHFLAHEVQERISVLEQRKLLLDATLQRRQEIYKLNLDTQLFLREADVLDSWMVGREPQLREAKLGESIGQVDDLIRRHEDFEKTVAAQEDKFQALKRITMLEHMFRKQREDEVSAKRAEKERIERERLDVLKQKEVQRITEERRRYDNATGGGSNANSSTDKTPIFSSTMVIKPSSSSGHSVPLSTLPDGQTGVHATGITVQKSNSVANIFGDRLRRGSEPGGGLTSIANVKRAESMKVGPKQPKRTPSFTTRRRAQSFRKNQSSGGAADLDLPPVEIQGMLERKHELQSGGKKAPVRSWKPFYTVLCGQLLCFFKDEEDFFQKKAATAPVNILHSKCEKAENYTKKKNVFRLRLSDHSEFLFLSASPSELTDWVNKISFHAALPPNLQLLSFDESMKVAGSSPSSTGSQNAALLAAQSVPPQQLQPPNQPLAIETSPISSRTSSPDSQRRSSRHDSIGSSMSGTSINTPQINFLQRQRELRDQQVCSALQYR